MTLTCASRHEGRACRLEDGHRVKHTDFAAEWGEGWDCGRDALAKCPDLASCERHGREWVQAPATWDDGTDPPPLSATDLRVLTLVSLGNSNAAIGEQLHHGEDWVKSRLRRIFTKIGALDRAHATRLGMEHGLISADRWTPPTPRDEDFTDTHIAACFAAEACPCRAGRRGLLKAVRTQLLHEEQT